MNKIIHVILSGGVGSRLWPLSRKSNPKQYLKLFKEGSLFAMTIERNRSLCQALTVVGNVDNYTLSEEVLIEKRFILHEYCRGYTSQHSSSYRFCRFCCRSSRCFVNHAFRSCYCRGGGLC